MTTTADALRQIVNKLETAEAEKRKKQHAADQNVEKRNRFIRQEWLKEHFSYLDIIEKARAAAEAKKVSLDIFLAQHRDGYRGVKVIGAKEFKLVYGNKYNSDEDRKDHAAVVDTKFVYNKVTCKMVRDMFKELNKSENGGFRITDNCDTTYWPGELKVTIWWNKDMK